MSSVGIIPNSGWVLVTLPKDAIKVPENLVGAAVEKAIELQRAEYVTKGNELIVVEVGANIEFLKRNDRVLIVDNGRGQSIQDGDEYYLMYRIHDILCKKA